MGVSLEAWAPGPTAGVAAQPSAASGDRRDCEPLDRLLTARDDPSDKRVKAFGPRRFSLRGGHGTVVPPVPPGTGGLLVFENARTLIFRGCLER
jgi:hypothetical protein